MVSYPVHSRRFYRTHGVCLQATNLPDKMKVSEALESVRGLPDDFIQVSGKDPIIGDNTVADIFRTRKKAALEILIGTGMTTAIKPVLDESFSKTLKEIMSDLEPAPARE